MAHSQLHKRLSQEQVVLILEHYLSKEISLNAALENLGVGKTRFFQILNGYQDQSTAFTVQPSQRTNNHRKISSTLEPIILEELKKEQSLIQNKDMPITHYNYSAVRDDIKTQTGRSVSVPTIIARAKTLGYHIPRPQKKAHDREVITNFVGELIQHDSSLHLWSPFMDAKLYLITSIDDYSRRLLYAELVEVETSWRHICSVESVVTRYGAPLKYYPDQHSIFRYVRDRDKVRPWQNVTVFTDEVDTQFKQVLEDCGVGLIYALSPQAKGKVERPYGWIQDRIVRTCAKEHITTITEVRRVLRELVYQYNHRWVHSTTKEIPVVRFERALKDGKSLFRPWKIKEPFQSSKDIFCLRDQRVVDNYQKISFHGVELKVPGVSYRQTVDLRVAPDLRKGIVEVRMWWKGKLMSTQSVKREDIREVQF